MRKLWTILTVSCLLLGTATTSDAEQIGFYAAPKFITGFSSTKAEVISSGVINGKYTNNFTKTTFGGAISMGYDFSVLNPEASLRTEIELSFFRKIKHSKSWDNGIAYKANGDINLGSLFLNLFYDIKNSTEFTPYLGAGVGFSSVKSKLNIESTTPLSNFNIDLASKTKRNFAWNIGAGVAYAFSEMFSLDLGYRFVSFGKGETKIMNYQISPALSNSFVGKTKTIYMHQLLLAARLTF